MSLSKYASAEHPSSSRRLYIQRLLRPREATQSIRLGDLKILCPSIAPSLREVITTAMISLTLDPARVVLASAAELLSGSSVSSSTQFPAASYPSISAPNSRRAQSLSGEIISRHSSLHPRSFSSAKRKLKKIFASSRRSFYCRCPMSLPHVLVKGCSVTQNYPFREDQTTIEFEHLYPMAQLKKRLLRKIGPQMKDLCPTLSRRCLTRKISLFSYFESDMMNIRPVIKKLNRARGAYWFALGVTDQQLVNKKHHRCTFRIENKKFHVPHHVKGDVARVMMYLDHSYSSLDLFDPSERQIFTQWNKADPLHPREALLLREISSAQGASLPYSTWVIPLAHSTPSP